MLLGFSRKSVKESVKEEVRSERKASSYDRRKHPLTEADGWKRVRGHAKYK